MNFTVEIRMGSKTMSDHADIVRALRRIADDVEDGNQNGLIYDRDRNRVGAFLTKKSEEEKGWRDGR